MYRQTFKVNYNSQCVYRLQFSMVDSSSQNLLNPNVSPLATGLLQSCEGYDIIFKVCKSNIITPGRIVAYLFSTITPILNVVEVSRKIMHS